MNVLKWNWNITNIGSNLNLSLLNVFLVYALFLTKELNKYVWSYAFSISVVEPGPVATEFSNTLKDMGFAGVEDGDEKTKKMVESFTSSLDKIKAISQKGEEVAECIQKVVEAEIPNIYYTTSPALDAMTAKKYVDITGNSFVNTAAQQYFK